MNSSEETKLNVLRDTLLSLRESNTIGVMFFHDAHEMLINAQRRAREKKKQHAL